jgi:hypothetical protein
MQSFYRLRLIIRFSGSRFSGWNNMKTKLLKDIECTEVQCELYTAADEEYISKAEFKDVYEQARRKRTAVRGFINYLKKYETREVKPTVEP